MNFDEVGAILRTEREKRNLTVDDIARQLKISPRVLRALESGDMAELPSAYAKGFMRSYASFLGLGTDDIRKAAENRNEDARGSKLEKSTDTVYLPEPEAVKKKSGKGPLIFIILCILGGCAYYGWQTGFIESLLQKGKARYDMSAFQTADTYMAQQDAQRKEAQETQRAEIEKEAKTMKDNGSDDNVQSNLVPDRVADPAHSQKNSTVQSPIAIGDEKNSTRVDIASITAQKASPAIAGIPSEKTVDEKKQKIEQHQLIITAIEECWIHSNADNSDTRQFSLRKGDTFALTFSNKLDLKLGNAGGVKFRYDGVDMPSPGTSGQVKTVSFPPKED